jgi:hypothetical protein
VELLPPEEYPPELPLLPVVIVPPAVEEVVLTVISELPAPLSGTVVPATEVFSAEEAVVAYS